MSHVWFIPVSHHSTFTGACTSSASKSITPLYIAPVLGDEVLKVALTKSLTPIDWVEIDLSQTQKGKELSSERPVN
ncbi:MAG: hypothetical protein ACKN91_00280 [Candidatus Fonsibacter sp.]